MTGKSNAAALASPVFWRYRPFFDLGPPGEESAISAHGPRIAFDAIANPGELGTQHSFGELFRISLLREAGISGYGFGSPLFVESSLRTEEWQQLCELVELWPSLTTQQQAHVCRLLTVLCFHRLVLRLVDTRRRPSPNDEAAISLAYSRAFCECVLRRDHGDRRLPEILPELLYAAPPRSSVRFSLAMMLLTDSAKARRDLGAASVYRKEAENNIAVDVNCAEFPDFDSAILISRFFRGASYIPFLAGDRERVTDEMDIAETAAKAAMRYAATEKEELIARETLFFVTESRMREAQWLGDHELWLARARTLLDIDPWCPKTHLELGEVLFATGNLAAADREYRTASRLGPPGTAVALYLAAQCRERLGDDEGACDAYYQAACLDRAGVSSTQGLARTAKRLGQRSLAQWADFRLHTLAATRTPDAVPVRVS